MTTTTEIQIRKAIEIAWATHLDSDECTQDMSCTICAEFERKIYGD